MEKPGEGKYFRQLLDGAPDAMLLVDEGGVILRCNRRTEELFGHDRRALVGHRVEVLVPKRFRGAHASERTHFAKAPVLRAMGERQGTVALRHDGSEFPADISLSPIFLDGTMHIVVAVPTPQAARIGRRTRSLATKNFRLGSHGRNQVNVVKGP